jgi:hypothetical protein
LSNRKLRNHVEHIDERLDEWTAVSPRPFLSIEFVLYKDGHDDQHRENIIAATAIVYDEKTNSVILFGDEFSLDELRRALLDVQGKCSEVLSKW